MRFCKRCGAHLNEQTGLCPNCDGSFSDSDKQPKPSNKPVVIAIVVAAFVTLLAAGLMFFIISNKNKNISSSISETDVAETVNISISNIDTTSYPTSIIKFSLTHNDGTPVTELGRQYVSVKFNNQYAELTELSQLAGNEFSAKVESPLKEPGAYDVAVNIDAASFAGSAFTNITVSPQLELVNEEQGTLETEQVSSASNDYIFPQSATVNLTDSDLENLSLATLRLARNEIFARHGYVFTNETYKQYFGGKSWYVPSSEYNGDISALNKFENHNVSLIQKYESLWSVADESVRRETSDNYYIFPQSGSAYLTDWDLAYLSVDTLQLARNEIFARHGYVFTNQKYNSYFGNQSWYRANSSYKGDTSSLNKYEKYNIDLIQQYENGTSGSGSTQSGSGSTQQTTEQVSYYLFPYSNSTYIDRSQLSGLSLETLQLARNEIYARHGYVFSNENYKSYFSSQHWYSPNSNYKGDDSSLNKYEKQNVALIKEFEDALK